MAIEQNFDCGCDRCEILRLDSLQYTSSQPPRSGHLSNPYNGHWWAPDWESVRNNESSLLGLMRTLVVRFRKIVRHRRWISNTGHYISTAAYRASLSRHGTATERSDNATSSPSTHYHAYRKYTDWIRSGGPFHCINIWQSFYILYPSSIAVAILQNENICSEVLLQLMYPLFQIFLWFLVCYI